MKKLTNKNLTLSTQTLRMLNADQLRLAGGGGMFQNAANYVADKSWSSCADMGDGSNSVVGVRG